MFFRRYSLYCHECRSKYTFKSRKELDAFKLGSDEYCPNCGEELSHRPFMNYVIPASPVQQYIINFDPAHKYDETFCEKQFNEFMESMTIKEDDIFSLMNLAVDLNNKVWFDELVDRLNSKYIKV